MMPKVFSRRIPSYLGTLDKLFGFNWLRYWFYLTDVKPERVPIVTLMLAAYLAGFKFAMLLNGNEHRFWLEKLDKESHNFDAWRSPESGKRLLEIGAVKLTPQPDGLRSIFSMESFHAALFPIHFVFGLHQKRLLHSPVEKFFGLRRKTLKGVDLSGMEIREFDLSGADLSGAKLQGTKFLGVNLSEADFTGASLMDAVFDGCMLEGATFNRADLRGAEFNGSISYARFDGANMFGADLADADFYLCKFAGANLLGVSLGSGRADSVLQPELAGTYLFEYYAQWVGPIYMKVGTDRPTEECRRDMEYLAGIMARFPGARMRLSGHADSSYSPEYGHAIGERHARSISNIMIREFGVPKERINADSYGIGKPKREYVHKGLEDIRFENRVEIALEDLDEPIDSALRVEIERTPGILEQRALYRRARFEKFMGLGDLKGRRRDSLTIRGNHFRDPSHEGERRELLP